MSDTCTVEIGLLKKHPCGLPAATKCANCEQPLCAKHAAPKMSAGKKLFLCPECAKAWKQIDDIPKPGPATATKPAEPPKPPAAAPKPAAVPKPAPAEKKPEPAVEHSGALEFTPGKPAAPEKKPEPAPAPAAKSPTPPPAGGKFELSIEQSAPPEPKPDDKK